MDKLELINQGAAFCAVLSVIFFPNTSRLVVFIGTDRSGHAAGVEGKQPLGVFPDAQSVQYDSSVCPAASPVFQCKRNQFIRCFKKLAANSLNNRLL